MPDESALPDTSPGALVMQAIAREVRRQSTVAQTPFRGTLIVHLRTPNGLCKSFSLVAEGRDVALRASSEGLPFAPRGNMTLAEEDLLALAKGECSAGELMRDGRLSLGGDAQILRAFAAYFQGGESWVSVRLARPKGS